jgi:carboxylesterase
MGALMSVHLAFKYPQEVSGVIALAPTFFYDGWAVDKKKFLMDILWHVPAIRNRVNILESWPYGLKDERTRGYIERFYKKAEASKDNNSVLLFGSPFFPMVCLYQHHLLTKVVRKELPFVKVPVLIIHAQEDDMTSLRNAKYLYNNIASEDKNLVILNDSYHMITIDKEKDKVASEMVNFINRL